MKRGIGLSSDGGYHLVDLLMCLCLVAILIASSLPAFGSLTTARALREEVDSLERALEFVHLEASQREETVVLAFTDNSYEAHLESAPDHTVLRHAVRAVVHLQLAEPRMLFFSSGVTTPTTLRLTDGRRVCSLVISLRGRVRSSC